MAPAMSSVLLLGVVVAVGLADDTCPSGAPCPGSAEEDEIAQLQLNSPKQARVSKHRHHRANRTDCAGDSDDCRESKCCTDPKKKCYEKSQYWAGCLETCDTEAVDPTDGLKWDCHLLSCAGDTDDCRYSKCCQDKGKACYEKSQYWAGCLDTCKPGMTDDTDNDPWSCNVLSCGRDEDNCQISRCCQDPGKTCYEKHSSWASCLPTGSCEPGVHAGDVDDKPWTCNVIS